MSQHGGALKRQLPLFRLAWWAVVDGQQWLSPISLRDEVRAILWLSIIKSPVRQFGLPEPLRNSEFTKALATDSIVRPSLECRIALQLVLGGELASSAVLASQRVLLRSLQILGFRSITLRLTR